MLSSESVTSCNCESHTPVVDTAGKWYGLGPTSESNVRPAATQYYCREQCWSAESRNSWFVALRMKLCQVPLHDVVVLECLACPNGDAVKRKFGHMAGNFRHLGQQFVDVSKQ